MKYRARGFLAQEKIDHESEIFDYIKELHDYLWRVVRVVYPGAGGSLDWYLDDVMNELESGRHRAARE